MDPLEGFADDSSGLIEPFNSSGTFFTGWDRPQGARAHFVFVLPQSGGTSARIVMNEELKPSSEVDIGIIGALKLSVRKGDGSETPLALVKGENFYEATVPGNGTRLLHGMVDLGMLQTGPGQAKYPDLLPEKPSRATRSAPRPWSVIPAPIRELCLWESRAL